VIVTQEEASYIEKFNDAVTHFSHFCFCTIDSGLQKEASAQIYGFLQQKTRPLPWLQAMRGGRTFCSAVNAASKGCEPKS
jgi:hypothetical protein